MNMKLKYSISVPREIAQAIEHLSPAARKWVLLAMLRLGAMAVWENPQLQIALDVNVANGALGPTILGEGDDSAKSSETEGPWGLGMGLPEESEPDQADDSGQLLGFGLAHSDQEQATPATQTRRTRRRKAL